MTTFTRYADPSHSWVRVPLSLLVELGIHDKVSGYSYMSLTHAYLEEDCDETLLYDALKAAGKEYKVKETWTNKASKVRNYASYRAYFAAHPVKDGSAVLAGANIPSILTVQRGSSKVIVHTPTQAYRATKQTVIDYLRVPAE